MSRDQSSVDSLLQTDDKVPPIGNRVTWFSQKKFDPEHERVCSGVGKATAKRASSTEVVRAKDEQSRSGRKHGGSDGDDSPREGGRKKAAGVPRPETSNGTGCCEEEPPRNARQADSPAEPSRGRVSGGQTKKGDRERGTERERERERPTYSTTCRPSSPERPSKF